MIEIKTYNENKDGFQMLVHIEGEGLTVVQQLSSIFDKIYEQHPKLFEVALLYSQYTDDHT